METDLIEKLATFVSRCNVEAFLRDFDKRGLRKILPSQAIRALSQAGLNLSTQEASAVMTSYTGNDGMFCYDDFLGDVSAVRRVGYFESNPTIDAAMTSPKARFGFRGAYLPTQFVPRAVLSEEDEKALVQTFEKLRYQTVMNPFVIATLMRPFDPVHCGSVTKTRFERVMSTHFDRIDANDLSLLSKAYADPRKENEVRYSALSADVTPDIVDDGMPRPSPAATKLVPGSPRPSVRKDHAPSPNVRLAESMALGASEDEMREGYRVLLRTLHERRIRIADVFRDFALHSPLAGRITRDQMIRGLSSIGLGSVTIDPRVVDAIAGMYTISSDPQWVDHVACIRDLEATTYLRHLETMDPFTLNETFSREVAMSPNPRFTVPVLPADDEKALQKVITALSARAARDRIFNVRIFAAQYDKQHNGFLTKDRFIRVLSTLKMLPETSRDTEILLKRFSTPSGYDYKTLLNILNLT